VVGLCRGDGRERFSLVALKKIFVLFLIK